MTESQYLVVADGDAWMVKHAGGELGRYASRDAAVVFAIETAQRLCKQGACAHVSVMDDHGRLRWKWTHCGWRKAT